MNIPTVGIEQLKHMSVTDIYNNADYTKFNTTYEIRYNNYYKFLEENKLETQLKHVNVDDFTYNQKDIFTNINISNTQYSDLKNEIIQIKKDFYDSGHFRKTNKLYKAIKKLPFAKGIAKKIK